MEQSPDLVSGDQPDAGFEAPDLTETTCLISVHNSHPLYRVAETGQQSSDVALQVHSLKSIFSKPDAVVKDPCSQRKMDDVDDGTKQEVSVVHTAPLCGGGCDRQGCND